MSTDRFRVPVIRAPSSHLPRAGLHPPRGKVRLEPGHGTVPWHDITISSEAQRGSLLSPPYFNCESLLSSPEFINMNAPRQIELLKNGISPHLLQLRVPSALVAQHKTEDDCWLILRGKVYCITAYLPHHPGGKQIIIQCSGKDATREFEKFHAWISLERMLQVCVVGIAC